VLVCPACFCANFHKRAWKPAIARLIEKGILVEQIVPKDLRATNASIVADAFGLVEAQRRMRHSSSNITGKHYARPLAGRDTQVANHLDGLMSKQPALALAN
jgi:integrase